MDKTTIQPPADATEILTELDPDTAGLLAAWKAEKAQDTPAGAAAGADDDSDAAAAAADDDDDGTGAEHPEAGDDAAGEEQEQEAESEEEAKEEEEKPAAEEPKSKVQKRIDTLTAKAKEAETALAAAQVEITALKTGARPNQPIALVPLPEDPLAHLTTPEAVEDSLAKAKGYIAWAKANRAGATVQGQTGPVEMSADDVEEFRAEQEAVLAAAPDRLKWLGEYQTAHAGAMAAYPELFQQGTEANAFVSAVIRQVPGLARHPQHEQLIGDMFAGAQLRTGKLKAVKAAAKPAPAAATAAPGTAKPKPSLSSSASSPAAAPRGAKPDTSAISAKAWSGDMDPDEAVAAMIAAKSSR